MRTAFCFVTTKRFNMPIACVLASMCGHARSGPAFEAS
jgi:hypothetical protein